MTDASQSFYSLKVKEHISRFGQNTITGPLPMLPTQQYCLNIPDEEPHIFNISLLLETHKPLDCQILAEATYILLAHHDALRSRFTLTADGWQATLVDVDTDVPFSQIDLSHVDLDYQSKAIEIEVEKLQGSLNLTNGPLIRIAYFFLGKNQPGRLLFVVHHFVTDGFSQPILIEDFFTAYELLSRGEVVRLPGKTTSIKQYAERLSIYAQTDAMQEIEYWTPKERMQAVALPADYPGGISAFLVQSLLSKHISKEETQTLLSLFKVNIPIHIILLAAFYRTYHYWTNQEIMLIDYISHGRVTPLKGIKLLRTVGYINSMVPLLLYNNSNASVGELVSSLKNLFKQMPNYGIGYNTLRYLGNNEVKKLFESFPWPQLHINYVGRVSSNEKYPDWIKEAKEAIRHSQSSRRREDFGIWTFMGIYDDTLWMHWVYHEKMYSRHTIDMLSQHFIHELSNIAAAYLKGNF